jgi:hypothetical protein
MASTGRSVTSRYSGPIPDTLWAVLHRAWKAGISLQSDFAREHAIELALAASCGFISTIDPNGQNYRGMWRITASGLTAYEHKELIG